MFLGFGKLMVEWFVLVGDCVVGMSRKLYWFLSIFDIGISVVLFDV